MSMNAIITENAWASAMSRGTATKQALLRSEGGVLTAENFADQLGLSRSDLDDLSLFRLDVDGNPVYPAFQLSGAGLLPGIEQVVRAFTIEDPWMCVNFMLTGDARLDRHRPIDLLREGRIDAVVAAAQIYGEHGAA